MSMANITFRLNWIDFLIEEEIKKLKFFSNTKFFGKKLDNYEKLKK